MKKYLLPFAALVLISCAAGNGTTDKKEGSVYAKGKLANATAGAQIYLEEMAPAGVKVIDTATIGTNGEFEFKKARPAIGFYNIKVSEASFATVILDSSKTVTVEGDATNLGYTNKVSGFDEAELFWELNERAKVNYRQRDSLQKVFERMLNSGKISQADMPATQKKLQGQFDSIVGIHESYVKGFLDKNPGKFAAMAALQQLPPDENFEYYSKVSSELGKNYPNSQFVKLLTEEVKNMQKTANGTEAPEITLPTPDGKELKLSSLRGQVVLLDFWASWCKPCRQENPNVVRLYNQYKDKGFTVFSVSLDKDKDSWVKAIKTDNLAWPNHVSDLLFWNTPYTKIYNFNSIPQTYLISKEGKIIGKNLRGEALEKKLAEVFK